MAEDSIAKYEVSPQNIKFEISRSDLAGLNVDQMTEANKEQLAARGGPEALCKLLQTDSKNGLKTDETDFEDRRKAYGVNNYPEPPMKGFLVLFIETFDDTVLQILMVAAMVSLVVGYIEDPEKGWIEGVAIWIAVLLVSTITAVNDYSKELQFRALKGEADNIDVKVMRDGAQTQISINDILVGDIVVLQSGDKIPCDGVLIEGIDIESNEASLTGEPEDLKKTLQKDPFLLSGCQITSGIGRMVVIAVGAESRWGRIKAKLAVEQQDTPLQEKLDDMAGLIGWGGGGAAALTFVAQMILWFLNSSMRLKHGGSETDVMQGFLGYLIEAFIIAVTIIVVAIPEGLPLAVTISLAYSTMKMLEDKNLIRVLAACETMGNATNICSDKTGTLTENRMTVVAGYFGGKYYSEDEFPASMDIFKGDLPALLTEGLSKNSTAIVEHEQTKEGPLTKVVGNKTEGAMLIMLEKWGVNYLKEREGAITKLFPFSSAKKRMSIVAPKADGGWRLYVKGASEKVLADCNTFIDTDGTEKEIGDDLRETIQGHILNMANNALRTLCIAHRDFTAEDLGDEEAIKALEESPDDNLVLEAVVGIIDPLRPDVKDAVRTCQEAGIMVRMVTGDNINTARAIAKQCGILTEGGVALEGPDFRTLTPAELDKIIPQLQVLARSSPDDKHTLVTRLNGKAIPQNEEEWNSMHPGEDFATMKDKLLPGYADEWAAAYPDNGEVVGVTGDGTNDAPALKAGDVGLSMGLSGTDVAQEASDIVILDDKFSSIVKAVLWGRSVYDNIRKFLQFQLTVNVVALTLTFIGACAGFSPPLNAVMMLWVNLIMDTMGALALGTELPDPVLLKRKPYNRTAGLVSNPMWRNILAQSLYQLVLLLVLLFAGADLFGLNPNGACLTESTINPGVCFTGDFSHYSFIFNTFVFCQFFNEINAREIADEWNVFSGLGSNPMFMAVLGFTFVFQVFVIEVGADFTKTSGLSLTHWAWSILLGSLSLPIGILMRLIPVEENPADFAGYDIPKQLK